MAKPLYVYTGSQWVPVASELESTSQYATTTYVDNKVGLDFIRTETFSAASTVSMNNVFSANYDIYRIMIDITTSALVNVNLRFRASGTDASGSNYFTQQIYAGGTSLTAAKLSSQTTYKIGTANTTLANRFRLDIFEPFKAEATGIMSDCIVSTNTGEIEQLYGNHNVTTSYDGVTIYPGSGTMTGIIRVYGYKN